MLIEVTCFSRHALLLDAIAKLPLIKATHVAEADFIPTCKRLDDSSSKISTVVIIDETNFALLREDLFRWRKTQERDFGSVLTPILLVIDGDPVESKLSLISELLEYVIDDFSFSSDIVMPQLLHVRLQAAGSRYASQRRLAASPLPRLKVHTRNPSADIKKSISQVEKHSIASLRPTPRMSHEFSGVTPLDLTADPATTGSATETVLDVVALEAAYKDLQRKYETAVWKHLRKYLFKNIPAVMKGDPVKTGMIGDYIIGQHLGRGAFGLVRAARHKDTDARVAIKDIKKDEVKSLEDVERIDSEIALLIKTNHPNIIRILNVYHLPLNVHIVMELVDNGNLTEYIDNNGPLPHMEVAEIFKQVLAALDYCHERFICHRDIKSDNILLTTGMEVKLSDFGLSCKVTPGELVKMFCGSAGYMAPEVLSGEAYNGLVADCWSLGILLLVMLTARMDSRLLEIALKISGNLEAVNVPELFAATGVVVEDILEKQLVGEEYDPWRPVLRGFLDLDVRRRLTVAKALSYPIFTGVPSSPVGGGKRRAVRGMTSERSSFGSPKSETPRDSMKRGSPSMLPRLATEGSGTTPRGGTPRGFRG